MHLNIMDSIIWLNHKLQLLPQVYLNSKEKSLYISHEKYFKLSKYMLLTIKVLI